jgi:GDP-L-fucose synthase
MMNHVDKIFVAGHRGMVGSAIVRSLQRAGLTNLLVRTHSELDLTNQADVRQFFSDERPRYVFLAAAKVGGILANDTYPAEFFYQNLLIEANTIDAAYRNGVERLLFLGSSCIYPKLAEQPLREDALLGGALEPTNRPYAVAKIAGVEMCWSYNRQYGTKYLAAMPTNLYGPGDNYDLDSSHVIPALIRKIHEAETTAKKQVEVWGTGRPRREFLYSDDLADACIYLMQLEQNVFERLVTSEAEAPLINVGCGRDQTIRELVEIIAEVVGFEGELRFDPTKPDGTPRKLLDTCRMESLGWRPQVELRQGLALTYEDFLRTHATKDKAHSAVTPYFSNASAD